MTRNVELKATLIAAADRFVSPLKKAGEAVAGLGTKVETFAKASADRLKAQEHDYLAMADRVTAVTDRVGQGFTRFGQTILGALGSAGAEAAGFQEALAELSIVSGETGAGLDSLASKALQLGAQTRYTATEAARGAAELARGGMDALTIKAGGLEAALAGASAGIGSVAEAGEIAAIALNLFGDSLSGPKEAMQLFVNTANSSATSTGKLAIALRTAGQSAAAANLTFRDFTVALGLLANAGVKGERAGTSLRALLRELVAPTEKVNGLLRQFGIISGGEVTDALKKAEKNTQKLAGRLEILRHKLAETTQAAGSDGVFSEAENKAIDAIKASIEKTAKALADWEEKRKDAAAVIPGYVNKLYDESGATKSFQERIELLADGFLKLKTEQERLAAIGLFPVEAQQGLLAFIEQIESARLAGADWYGELTEAQDALGSIDDVSKRLMDNWNGSVARLTSSLSELKIRGMLPVLEQLQPLIDKITAAVNATTQWQKANTTLTTGLVTKVGVIGGVATGLGFLISVLGVIAGSILAIKAALVSFGLTWASIVIALKAGAASIFSVGFAKIIAILLVMNSVLGVLDLTWGDVVAGVLSAVDKLLNFVGLLFTTAWRLASAFFQLFTGGWSQSLKTLQSIWEDWRDMVVGGIDYIFRALEKLWLRAKQVLTFVTGQGVAAEGTRAQTTTRVRANAREIRLQQLEQQQRQTPAAQPASAQTFGANPGGGAPSAAHNNSRNVTIGALNINGADNPRQTANALLDQLRIYGFGVN